MGNAGQRPPNQQSYRPVWQQNARAQLAVGEMDPVTPDWSYQEDGGPPVVEEANAIQLLGCLPSPDVSPEDLDFDRDFPGLQILDG